MHYRSSPTQSRVTLREVSIFVHLAHPHTCDVRTCLNRIMVVLFLIEVRRFFSNETSLFPCPSHQIVVPESSFSNSLSLVSAASSRHAQSALAYVCIRYSRHCCCKGYNRADATCFSKELHRNQSETIFVLVSSERSACFWVNPGSHGGFQGGRSPPSWFF